MSETPEDRDELMFDHAQNAMAYFDYIDENRYKRSLRGEEVKPRHLEILDQMTKMDTEMFAGSLFSLIKGGYFSPGRVLDKLVTADRQQLVACQELFAKVGKVANTQNERIVQTGHELIETALQFKNLSEPEPEP